VIIQFFCTGGVRTAYFHSCLRQNFVKILIVGTVFDDDASMFDKDAKAGTTSWARRLPTEFLDI
jgi:hypothetical protein